jgi:hypothetical protein
MVLSIVNGKRQFGSAEYAGESGAEFVAGFSVWFIGLANAVFSRLNDCALRL